MQLIAFLLLVLIVFLLFSAKKESLSPAIKRTVGISLFVVILLVFAYEIVFSKKQLGEREMINHFQQNGALMCQGKRVDMTHYRFENGTQSFVAKEEYVELRGIIIPLSDCEVAPQ